MIERPAVLAVERLSKRFDKHNAVENIDLSLSEGEIVSLLGPSGCGKTTTLRCIAGFYRPDGGTISIGGRTIVSDRVFVQPEERNLAMVFQNYVLWPHMRAFDNVAYGLKLRGIDGKDIAKRVHHIMDVLGLAGLADRYPHALSGGQQQRLSVARSLVVEPTILLLDEPFSNLDAKLRIDMRREMRDLLKRLGTTAIYVTHDQEEAMALSDRILLMNGGRIVQQGTPVELFERPRSRFTAQFFGISNFVEGRVESGPAGPIFVAENFGVTIPLEQQTTVAEPGKRQVLALREEAIDVSPTPRTGPDWFAGTINSRTYLGGAVQLSIGHGKEELHARVPGSEALNWPADVFVRFISQRAILLPSSDGHRA